MFDYTERTLVDGGVAAALDELDARGESYTQPGIEDVVFGYLRFPSGLAAHLDERFRLLTGPEYGPAPQLTLRHAVA